MVMRVWVRVDASQVIGSGHVMRCLTLAACLAERGAEVVFACRELPGHLLERIAGQFSVVRLPAQYAGEAAALSPETPVPTQADLTALQEQLAGRVFDWCVLDHYGLDVEWERQATTFARYLLVIDDLRTRSHCCDVLLDQNFHGGAEAYGGAVQQRLFGPHYALLRPEFAQHRAVPRPAVTGATPRLLLFFGGGATGAHLLQVLPELADLDVAIDVLSSAANATLLSLPERLQSDERIRLHIDSREVAAVMQGCDLYLGAGGSITWERACLGLPGIVAAVSDNQKAICLANQEKGFDHYLGAIEDVAPGSWRTALLAALNNPEGLAARRRNAAALVDGLGAQRVVDAMEVLL